MAEEVLAETYLVAWRRMSDVPEPVLRHHGRAQVRAATTRQNPARLSAAFPPAVDAGDRLMERDELLATLAGMRESDREALLLIAWDGLTPADGKPALVIPDGWHGADQASVEVVRHGIAITIYGSLPTKTLLRVASTVN
jgi:hypothetical protein